MSKKGIALCLGAFLVCIDIAAWAQEKSSDFLKLRTKGSKTIIEVSSSQRFIDNGDGTVTDTKTGLMWTKKGKGGKVDRCLITWESAKEYCEELTLARYSDWRLPSIDELRTLYAENYSWKPKCDEHRFSPDIVHINPIFELACDKIWSSEEYPSYSQYFPSSPKLFHFHDNHELPGPIGGCKQVLAVRTHP